MDRRTVLKSTGAAAGASLFATTGAAAGVTNIDSSFDLSSDDVLEALVVFEPDADYGVLDRFDLPVGYHAMEAVDIVYTKAVGSELERIAGLQQVRYVEANKELEYENGDAQIATGAGTVQDRFDLGYTGDGVHVAVIDSGVDAYHPDLQDRLRHNYQFVDPLAASGSAMWQDAGTADTDDIGHGTHCSGSIVGEGNQNATYEGMAPDANLTVYSTGAGLFILNAVAAYNHLLENHAPGVAEGDEVVRLTSNSYGGSGGNDFNPAGAQETATFRAFDAGITVVSSAGNSGPGTNTLGGAKTAPHILCIAASHDGQGESGMDATTRPTDFSSRGRTADYDQGEGARWDEFPNGSGGYTAEDRVAALENVKAFHEADLSAGAEVTTKSEDFTAGPGVDGSVAADEAQAGSPTYVSITTESATGFIEASISWTPPGQDLDINLREGGQDGNVVGSAATLSNPEQLNAQVEPDQQYTFEIIPYAAVQATGTIDITEREAPDSVPTGPFGVYRPSVIAPGSGVISTMGASALKALEASYGATPDETGAFYSALSGTSMSCPITSGVVCQVIEAYYRNHPEGQFPSPEQVIRFIEAGASPDAEKDYTPYNAGAGLVNAVESVNHAITEAQGGIAPAFADIDLATPGALEFLSASGSRTDDGQLYTGGQTNMVTVTVDSLSHEVTAARELMPDGWTVVGTGEGVTAEDDGTTVTFDVPTVNEATADDESASFTYFVEAPSGSQQTNSYTFGGVQVKSDQTDDDGFVTVAGTSSTEYVVGPSTNL
ncbi:S8 family serine peptidase [Halorarius litoreus]|uniref:S8 family serine peptidase n=1 Tax=Halorarius litoreus TaxID=2962676 RepID=UPI0020CCEF7A|nr:S8 family serine peptidase [Halorarius litoreus]